MSAGAGVVIISRRWLTRAIEDHSRHVAASGEPADAQWLGWLQRAAEQLRSIRPGEEVNLAITDASTWRREEGDELAG